MAKVPELQTPQRPSVSELEANAASIMCQLKSVRSRVSLVQERLFSTRQSIDALTQERRNLAEVIKDTNWEFTRDTCESLSKLKSPNKCMLEVAEMFMCMLDQQDTSWRTFKAVTRHFEPIKSLMTTAQFDSQREVQSLLPFWQNRQQFMQNVSKYGKAAQLLVNWLSYSVEYKVKTELLHSHRKQATRLETKGKELRARLVGLSEKLLRVEEALEQGGVFSEASRTSTLPEETRAKWTPGEPASGCPHMNLPEFPNFDQTDLYQEAPCEDELLIEGPAESFGFEMRTVNKQVKVPFLFSGENQSTDSSQKSMDSTTFHRELRRASPPFRSILEKNPLKEAAANKSSRGLPYQRRARSKSPESPGLALPKASGSPFPLNKPVALPRQDPLDSFSGVIFENVQSFEQEEDEDLKNIKEMYLKLIQNCEEDCDDVSEEAPVSNCTNDMSTNIKGQYR